MEVRKCEYCSKTLPSNSHKRRKYCEGKRCKTRAYEKRKGITNKYGIKPKTSIPVATESKIVSIGSGTNEMLTMLRSSLKYWEKVYADAQEGKFYLATLSLGSIGAVAADKNDKLQQALYTIAGAGIGAWIDNQRKQQIIADAIHEIRTLKIKIAKQQEVKSIVSNIDFSKLNLQTEPENVTSVSGSDLAKMKFDSYRVDGKYNELLGDLERGFNLAIFGSAGSGKSSVAVDLASNLKNHGRVLYFATEEGIGKSLQSKIQRYKAKSPHITFDICNDWNEIKSKIDNAQYVIFDSIERIKGITPDSLNDLYRKHKSISFISILQANKDGSYKGDSKYGHDVDIIWKAKKLSVWNDKNRYGGTGIVNLETKGNDRANVRT